MALDGTGYGPDHTIWGGELLRADLADYERLGRVRTFRLPGGEAAVRQPWRIALGMLIQVYGERWADQDLDLIRGYAAHGPLIARMMEREVNSPLTSSLGRLFGAVSALAGVRTEVAYEGQAAVELEQIMAPGPAEPYPLDLIRNQGLMELDWEPMLREAVRNLAEGAPADLVSARFHAGLVKALADWAASASRETGLTDIVLGGGCFMNAYLLTNLPPLLENHGLTVFSPALVPAGDGAISLGQAVCAAKRGRED
jgi:hydrogenase maturation protein HypF